MADPWNQLCNTLVQLTVNQGTLQGVINDLLAAQQGQAGGKVKVEDIVSNPGTYVQWFPCKVLCMVGKDEDLGTKVERWFQMKLQAYGAINIWPLWANLQTEVEAFFLSGNHTD
ncbi:hypothetical protein V8B97DRAFT_1918307 [Scleroderma yunnanense]